MNMDSNKKTKISKTADIIMLNVKFSKEEAMDIATKIHMDEWKDLASLEDKRTESELVKRNKGNLTFELFKKMKPSPSDQE